MKSKFFMAALAVAMIFSACNTEEIDNGGNTIGQGEAATLKVSIAPITPRAGGANPGSNTTDMLPVSEATIIVFDANDDVIGSAVVSSNPVGGSGTAVETTTNATRVLVVTNLNGLLTTGGALNTSLTNLAQVNERVVDQVRLAGTAGPTGATSTSLVVLAGDVAVGSWAAGTPGVTIDPDGTANKSVNLAIRPISSKLDVNVTLGSAFQSATVIEGGSSPGLLRFKSTDGVRILNAVSQTKVIGATPFANYTPAGFPWLVPNPKAYFQGMNTSGFVHNAGGTVQTFLADPMANAAAGSYPFHYYLFENDAEVATLFPTILVVQATWGWDVNVGSPTAVAAGDDFGDFDPFANASGAAFLDYATRVAVAAQLAEKKINLNVHMTSAIAGALTTGGVTEYGAGIQRGKAYGMNLTLSNDMIDVGGDYWFPDLPIVDYPVLPPTPGPTDPTDEETDANLTVVVTVQNWVPVTIDKEW
ncbi:MAG: hypothetical protein LBI15_09350 [Dysgonamonadaceae bacterium]|jgi:hypothetical protein|nr:hypothetical protein [Dysgonamonadaceae bacterium]